ncbi:MAG: BACON domain-containing carbohydrate-binding protein [Prevotella sp.]|nr:DNA-binding protein [Prevotella sp.]MDY3252664.1 BACON domain-containing carbohydrate-binding protein [Prevotella sp.]MDY4629857.1 BACON domain-containing carbohydrate-binding protein [Prevotella sp.]
MKLKYFIPMFIMALAMLTSCSDDEVVTYPDGLRVSSSYMALPVEGGSASIDVYCNQKWEVDTVGAFPKKEPWFDYSVSSSDKGQVLTITADETLDGRSTSIKLVTEGGSTQIINVMQGLSTVSTATCAEVIAGPDSKTYQVKGVCTSIANTTYGNWYLNDGTGEIYIYGTLDKNGATKNFLSLGIEVGDEITVEGPKTTYGSTIELVNVTVIAINKSLIKVDSTYVGGVASNELPLEGGELTAYVTCKGQGVTVDIPEDAKEWLSISAIKNGGSEVVFKAAPNTGGDRNTTVIFKTTDGKKEYNSQMAIAQKGAIVPLTVAEFNAKEVGDVQYRLTGLVTKVDDAAAGKYYISDYTGQVYVYKASGEVSLNDVVTIVGKHAEFKGTPQVGSGKLEEVCASAEPISLADFNAAADDNDKLYVLTGKIVEIVNDKYGNVYIEDENGEKVYLYGVYGDWTGENKKNFITDNGIAVGDEITVVTIKTSHNDAPQGKNAVCFGVKKAN